LVTQIYMKPFGYPKFFFNFFEKWRIKRKAVVTVNSERRNKTLFEKLG
jgi:hypothetical protein